MSYKVFGGHSDGVTPGPIPNPEVKPICADGTWGESPWESRSPPNYLIKSPAATGAGLLCIPGLPWLELWRGSRPLRCSGGRGREYPFGPMSSPRPKRPGPRGSQDSSTNRGPRPAASGGRDGGAPRSFGVRSDGPASSAGPRRPPARDSEGRGGPRRDDERPRRADSDTRGAARPDEERPRRVKANGSRIPDRVQEPHRPWGAPRPAAAEYRTRSWSSGRSASPVDGGEDTKRPYRPRPTGEVGSGSGFGSARPRGGRSDRPGDRPDAAPSRSRFDTPGDRGPDGRNSRPGASRGPRPERGDRPYPSRPFSDLGDRPREDGRSSFRGPRTDRGSVARDSRPETGGRKRPDPRFDRLPTYGTTTPEPRAERPKRNAADRVPVVPVRTELWESAGWESDEVAEAASAEAVTIERVPKQRPAPAAVSRELTNAVGPRRAPKVEAALMEASKAFERERYSDALTILRALAVETPDVPAVRELMGLCLYRQAKWNDALRHLERFVELTGSVEQHPVIADCHRGLRHYDVAEKFWEELAASSPSAELVAEGRIVMAGSLADQGRLRDAIALLERAPLQTKRPRAHHLRLWYALGDLYERAGDVPNAREWFARVLLHDADLADTADRLANL
jgi:hypothetical protein